MNNCRGCNDPQVVNEGIDCDGNFISDECVELTEAHSQLVGILSTKIDYTELDFYVDNASAIIGGVGVGEPYKTPTGELRVVV